MNRDEVICTCMDVTKGMIADAVEAGADSVEAVQKATGAGTVCGLCLDNVTELVGDLLAEKGGK